MAKIQENETIIMQKYDMEKDFQEKEKIMDVKINDLQKKIHQLDQDVQEKENECAKLNEDLQLVNEQRETL